ncbi:serine/threonine-protein kinase [Actinomadura chokoriensis]|uniref:Serine/threonine-protein kinase n=1 Tax=Actinomadura chokoriensis TaxID=454156 RepID=A0ABV4R0H3_9ACTN
MSGAGLKALRAGDPARVGPYRLLARLGAGGMGQVYLGRSRGRRLVAVKIIHPHFADNASFRRRFAKEVAAARRIGGFYTAQVVDADADADQPWLVTEYIAGPTLQDAVDENGPLPEVSVAALGAGLAEGLRAVHEQNVIHRDLKPGNVLLAHDGPRIIDFGIARALDSTSQSLTLVGTPGYMSPEQYLGGEIGPPSDVFCLAGVLTFAATGRHPFGEGPPDALGYRVRHEQPDLTRVPAALLGMIAAGLEKDPDDRPPTGDFLDRCSALAVDEGMTLPDRFTTMIATRVAETEVFAGKADTGERPPRDRRPPRQQAKQPPPGGAKQRPPQDKQQGKQQGQQQGPPRPPQGPPQRTPQGQPPGQPKPPAKQNGGSVAGVIGVLAVVLLIIFAAKHDDSGTPSNVSGNSTPSSSWSPSSRWTPSPSDTEYTPTPTPDPTWEAFDEITVNDCLDAYEDPYDASEWSEDMPNAVACGRSDAYVQVTGIRSSASACSSEALDGESWWSSPTNDGERIYLCLRRQFREGECFLGKNGSAKGKVAITGHGLMTSWSCNKNTVPRGFNYILQFTGYYESTCPDGSLRWDDFREGVLCARVV